MAEIYPQEESRMALEVFYVYEGKCIDLSIKLLMITQANCLHCGNCMTVCLFGAIEKR